MTRRVICKPMPEMVKLEKVLCRSAPWRFWTRRFMVPWALQGIRPRGTALEIGGGSGLMSAEMLRCFPELKLTVTDLDAAMLETALHELEPQSDRAVIEVADASQLPFQDGSFDQVFSFIMLHHVVSWERAVGEALRVLRPGRWFVGYDILDTWPLRVFHKLERADVRLIKLVELQSLLEELDVERCVLTPGGLGTVVRFKIQKAT
jgi:ubiquinone/menaquinone biosynthesis C-methylase UbiE